MTKVTIEHPVTAANLTATFNSLAEYADKRAEGIIVDDDRDDAVLTLLNLAVDFMVPVIRSHPDAAHLAADLLLQTRESRAKLIAQGEKGEAHDKAKTWGTVSPLLHGLAAALASCIPDSELGYDIPFLPERSAHQQAREIVTLYRQFVAEINQRGDPTQKTAREVMAVTGVASALVRAKSMEEYSRIAEVVNAAIPDEKWGGSKECSALIADVLDRLYPEDEVVEQKGEPDHGVFVLSISEEALPA